MSLVAKLNHGGLQTLGDVYATETGKGVYANLLQVSTISTLIGDVNMTAGNLTVTLGNGWFKKDLTVGDPTIGTSTLTVYGLITVPAGAGYTTGLLIERNVSIAGTLDLVGGLDINGDVTLEIGHTLKVDNILKSDAGLGTLDIEGIGVEGSFLYTDNIAEKTGGVGVRIDRLRIIDNTINHITPGTEIIIEEDTRIRDPHKLEVSNIYEADLSSDITLHSNTIINSSFTTKFNTTVEQLAGTGSRAVYVDTNGKLITGSNYIDKFDATVVSGNDNITPTYPLSFVFIDLTAVSASEVIYDYDLDLDAIEASDQSYHVYAIVKMDASTALDCNLRVGLRNSSNGDIWTNQVVDGDPAEEWEIELIWNPGQAEWIVYRNTQTV